MTDQSKYVASEDQRLGKETGPLLLGQLSDNELTAIIEIERRLYEAQSASLDVKETAHPLASSEQLYERVLLLDGGRGTGKSSLLQTLIQRWTSEDTRKKLLTAPEYATRIKALPPPFVTNEHDVDIPTFVKVFPILDFDPLPTGMPLLAGIVQAWKMLAIEYGESFGEPEDIQDESGILQDRWHRLFHVAAIGWTGILHEKGLIEQVLDQEEQVQHWHRLRVEWQIFVDKVIKAENQVARVRHRASESPVFVIIIDDVDLQVGRMQQLLPALRILYHPNVVFIVAADKNHMMDMLRLSFLGQQRQLAGAAAWDKLDRAEQWPYLLAQASIQKIFPLRNTWKLRKLSLRELLEFPKGYPSNFGTYFESWHQQDTTKSGAFGNLASYLEKMAGSVNDPIELPLVVSYRAAHQIFDQVKAHSKDTPVGALTAIRGILLQALDEETVAIASRPKSEADKPAVPNMDPTQVGISEIQARSSESTKNAVRMAPNIIFRETGNLKAIFPEVFVADIGNDSEIVLSGYPEFSYVHGRSSALMPQDSAEFVAALIAGSLRDDGYGILAPGLQWNIRTAIAWTSARLLELNINLTLRWQLHIHPSPLRLYHWANEWSRFIETLSTDAKNLDSRIAYAWVYYQLKWLGADVEGTAGDLPQPTTDGLDPKEYWTQLLQIAPKHESQAEIDRWRSRTLPLMARPELGLPPKIQELLLTSVKEGRDIEWLHDQRERLITDGIIASQDLGMPTPENPESQKLARDAANRFDARHAETHEDKAPWVRYVTEKRNKTKQQEEKT